MHCLLFFLLFVAQKLIETCYPDGLTRVAPDP